jgi:O-antigen ligase
LLTVLLAIEAIWGLPLNRTAQPGAEIGEIGRNVSRAASLHLALVWGAAGLLISAPGLVRGLAATAVLAAGAFISIQFGQFAHTLGYASGLAAFLAALAAPRTALLAVFAGLLFWLLAAPFATPLLVSALSAETLPESWRARIEIWTYVCERILEQPWFGHGLDAARTHAPLIPVHPHSASLQIWFEMGAVGVLTTAALVIAAGRDLLRKLVDHRLAAAAAAGTIAALGIVLNVSYNLWAEWWLTTLFLAAGVIGALQSGSRALGDHEQEL